MNVAEFFDRLNDPIIEKLVGKFGATLHKSSKEFNSTIRGTELEGKISWQHMVEVCLLYLTAVNSSNVEELKTELRIFSDDFHKFTILPEGFLQEMINEPSEV